MPRPASPQTGLAERPLLAVTPPVSLDRYVRVGRLLGDAADACVEPRDETVIGLFSGEEVFVGSSLDLFVETLYLVNRMALAHVDATDDRRARAVDELFERLSTLDPPAMADNGWWVSLLDEMRFGLS